MMSIWTVMRERWVRVMIALIALLHPQYGLAADPQDNDKDEKTQNSDNTPPNDAIIVVGRRITSPDFAVKIPITVVSRDYANFPLRIESALKDNPAFIQFRRSDSRSANATSQGVTVRGLGGNASSRVLLVLDGVPQTDPFGGWVTWPAYNPLTLRNMTLNSGGGHVTAGPGAIAGTIEMESLAADHLPLNQNSRQHFKMEGGSRGSVEAAAAYATKLGGGYAVIGGGYAQSDGFIPIIKDQRGPADRPAPYRQWNVSGRAVIPFDAQTELQANVLVFSDQRERGLAFTKNGGRGGNASLRLVHRGAWQVQATGWLQMRKFESQFSSVNATRNVVTPTLDQYNVPSTGIGAQIEVHPPVGTGDHVRLGVDTRHVSGRTNELFTFANSVPTRGREAGGVAQTTGGYVEGERVLGDLTLKASARLDHWRLNDGRLIERILSTGAPLRNDVAPVRTGWQPTGRLGLVYERDGLELEASAYRGWRLPTLNELYRPFRLGAEATAANAALKPETMQGAEATARLRWTSGSFGLNGFINRMRNPIANVTVAQGPGNFPGVGFVGAGGSYRQRQNLDAIRSRGVEVQFDQRFGDFNLMARYAFTDAKVRSSGNAASLNNRRPAQVPQHGVYSAVSWANENGTLGVSARYTSSQFEDDVNTRRLADALSLDVNGGINIAGSLSLTGRIENLTNARIEAAISPTGIIERATPRTVWIGVQFRN